MTRGFCTKHYKREMKGSPLVTWKEKYIIDHPPTNGIGLIPLTKGTVAIVDEEDYWWLMQWKWCARQQQKHCREYWYAVGRVNAKVRLMHRVIMRDPAFLVDHINGDGLDNRRSNLRVCSASQNQQNRNKANKRASSIYKGVSWNKLWKRWDANMMRDGQSKYLGGFASECEAAKAYDRAAINFDGPFAKLNLPD